MKDLRYRQIHLDFHTSELIAGIGKEFDSEEFARTLSAAGVDSITCFSKCHHGMLYHDTRFESKHPHLTCNLLVDQIEACHAHDIRVPIYISAGLDEFSATRHPEWVEMDKDGKRSGASPIEAGWKKLCFNSPYVDYLVEQTEEVLDIFGSKVDGLFFDIIFQGECHCVHCMDGMLKGGYDPESEVDSKAFAAKVLSDFKDRMTAAIRAKDQKCGIFFNAGHVGPAEKASLHNFSHLELESLPSGGWGYEHFPITSRYARNLGFEFIGMTGKFAKSWADFGGFKNPAALQYECFSALALGGGCSVGDQLHPSGKLTAATYDLIGDVYHEVARKEPWCRGVAPVVEIGVVTPEVLPGGVRLSESASGIHRMLSEKHYQYDFIDFDMDFSKYAVVVLPDCIRLDDTQASVVNDYVKNGGALIVSGESGMGVEGYDFVINDMPVVVKGPSPFSPDYLVVEDAISDGVLKTEHVMYDRGMELELAPGAKSLADVWKPYFERSYKHFCSHFHTPVEGPAGYPGIVMNGNIVYIGYPIFGMYKRHGARVYRDMVINALKLLLPDEKKLIVTNAPTTADITLNYQAEHDRYVLHILHYIPERRYNATDTIEDIIPLHNISLELKLPKEYTNASIVPDDRGIVSAVSGNKLSINVPEVNGHCMIAISADNK